MIDSLRAEFKKLLTVRSTYIVAIVALVLLGIASGFIGYQTDVLDAEFLNRNLLDLVPIVGLLSGIIAILLVAHEYRYNTISYTLTSTNQRLKPIASKMIVVATFAIVLSIVASLVVAAITMLFATIHDSTIIGQQLEIFNVGWRILAFNITSALAGLLFAVLFRNIVFSIVAFLVLPSTLEPLLSGLLKVNHNYLPFTAQGQITSAGSAPFTDTPNFSPLASLGVFVFYLAVGWLLAGYLFVKRDAN